MSSHSEVLHGVEQVFQQREKEIVIEFGVDRILHYLGVYLLIILSVLSKVSDITGNNLSCYPTRNETGFKANFAAHATSFCWESSHLVLHEQTAENKTSAHACSKYTAAEEHLLKDAALAKRCIQLMPYIMLLEAFLLSFPSAWWHYRVGARLMGHLKFMKLLLIDVYDSLKKIPAGIYRDKPYDKESKYLNGWGAFNRDYKRTEQQGLGGKEAKESDSPRAKNAEDKRTDESLSPKSSVKASQKSENPPKIYEYNAILTLDSVVDALTSVENLIEESDEEGDVKDENEKTKTVKQEGLKHVNYRNILERYIFGDIVDQHLFSMLCYENFSSLENHPYIISIYQLTSTQAADKDVKGVVPMKQGILRQFCHENNFRSRFIVKTYMLKNIFNMTLSFIVLFFIWLTFGSVILEMFGTKTFLCNIPYHDVCVVCSLKANWDMLAIFITNSILILAYFMLSAFQFYFIRFGSGRDLCHYFKDLSDLSSVALLSAHKVEHIYT